LTAVELSWQLSEGATKYRLTQTDMDGAPILSNDFEIVNSTNIYNLEESLEYIFTVYSGNSNGFDLSEGRSTVVSTSSIFFFGTFYLSFLTINKIRGSMSFCYGR